MIKDFLELMKSENGYNTKFHEYTQDIQIRAKKLTYELNMLSPENNKRKEEILKELFMSDNISKVFIESPFHCDYGFNIHFEGLTLINYNCSILDTSPVYIGEHTLIGPGVCITCAGHAIHPEERKNMCTSKPIHIGKNVWIGANATILSGVHIGNGSIIGAGSVVNKDIPENVVAAGVPCKVIREITEEDRLNLECDMKAL